MRKKDIFAGYINLKPINGVIFPSYAQNQINKDYIVGKLGGEFFLSTNDHNYSIFICMYMHSSNYTRKHN